MRTTTFREWEHKERLGEAMPKGGHLVVGTRLKEAMRKAGLNIKEVAEALEINRGTVHRWLSNDRTPDAYLLERFAALVGEMPEYFWAEPSDDLRQRIAASIVRVLTRLGGNPPMPAINALALEVGPIDIEPASKLFLQRREE